MSDQIPPAVPSGAPYGQPQHQQKPPKKKHTALIVTLSCVGAFLVLVCAVGVSIMNGVGDALDEAGQPNAVASHSADPSSTNDPSNFDTGAPEPTGPAKLKIGAEVSVSQDSMDGSEAAGTVGVEKVDRYTGPVVDYGLSPANGTFLVFTMKVKGDAGKFEFNPSDFYVRGDDGGHYDMGDGNSFDAVSGGNILDYVTVGSGEHVSGPVPFDAKGKHGTLVYDPNYSGSPIAEWSF